jgi:glycosyltransferase 2 family protein
LTNEKRKISKTKISIIASVALSISIILLILYFTINKETLQNLSQVSVRPEFFLFFGAAVVLNVISWVIWAARLKIISKAIAPDVHVSLWESTKIVIANLFLAGITPSMAGGEPVRIYLLKKDGMTFGGATAAVLGERLIDAIFILVTIPFALLVFKDYIVDPRLQLGVLVGVVAFILFIVVFLYASTRPLKVKALLIIIDEKIQRIKKKKAGKKSIIERLSKEVDNFSQSMVFFLKQGKKTFLLGGILTVAMWSVGFMIPSMLLLSLGLPPLYFESYAAQIILLIIIMLPLTPGSSGIAELGMYGLYGIFLNTPLLGVLVLLFRFITYHMNVICGAVFQYRIFKSITSFSFDSLGKK